MNKLPKTSVLAAALATTLGVLALSTTDTFAAPGAHGPNGEHLDGPSGPPSGSGLVRLPDGSVNVPMAAQRRMGIRTMFSKSQEAAASVELLGRVVNDPNAGGVVQATSGGRIEAGPDGLPTLGQAVRKGQVLGYVRYGADPYARANQEAQLAKLRADLEVARERVGRLKALSDTVPRKDVEAAQAELGSLESATRSVGAGLDGREPLVAPVDGIVAQADAIAGKVVDAEDVLFQIVDPRRLQIEAFTADTAATRIDGASVLESGEARLRLIGAAASLRDGLIPIRFGVTMPGDHGDGTGVQLVVGQPVTVVARMKDRTRGVVLPREAVARNAANEPIVWIKSGAERYIPQPVKTQSLDAANVVVVQGLGEDNRVVTQGAALLAQIR